MTTETDVRRFRVLQIVEVEPRERIASGHALDALRGQHFSVSHELFQEDLAWLEGLGHIKTGPLDEEAWIALTDTGREVVDLAQPGPALRSIALGRGAHLTLCSHEAISASKLDTLAAAARSLVDTVLGDSQAAPGQGAERDPDTHLGARESS